MLTVIVKHAKHETCAVMFKINYKFRTILNKTNQRKVEDCIMHKNN